MKRSLLEIIAISIGFCITLVKGDYFTSISHMSDLVKIENMLNANLNKYIASQENKLHVIKT